MSRSPQVGDIVEIKKYSSEGMELATVIRVVEGGDFYVESDSWGPNWRSPECEGDVKNYWGWPNPETSSIHIVDIPEALLQTPIDTAFELVPPTALKQVAQVLKTGAAKYGENSWRKIAQKDHLSHALKHIYAHLAAEKTGENDLVNAVCRLLFSIEVE